MTKIRLTSLALLALLCGCQAPLRGALPAAAPLPVVPPAPAAAPVVNPIVNPVVNPNPAPVTPLPAAVTQTDSNTVNGLIQKSMATTATTDDVQPAPGWVLVPEDVQALAEAFAPQVVMPDADKANAPVSMLYLPYRQGRFLAFRYLVQYQDEDLKSSWEDKLYDLFRKAWYGSVVDIEPIEVIIDEESQCLEGVAFKTGQNQDFYKILVKENTWLTIKASDLRPADHDDERPRMGVSTWNHLHDLPSVLQGRQYPPTFNAPAVPVSRIDQAAAQKWRFDRRHITGGPRADVTKLATSAIQP